jgi:mannose/fructose/N-acetylgalactosamine-specific phosphotransferase system component IIB
MAHADLYWETEVVSGGMPEGLPKNLPKQVLDQMMEQFKAKTETTKNYLTSYASRTETGGMIIIMEFDTMTMYQLDPRAKTYTKINIMSEMGQMAEEMMKDMKVTPTNETKEIAGYKCKKYNVTVMDMKSERWLSKDVKGYKEFKAINEKIYKKHPKLRQMNMGGMSGKEGFPVQTVSNMMGMKTTTTLKKIDKKSLSKNLFKVPGGYKLKELKMPLN